VQKKQERNFINLTSQFGLGKITGRSPLNLFSTKWFFLQLSSVAFGGKMKVGEKQKLATGPNHP